MKFVKLLSHLSFWFQYLTIGAGAGGADTHTGDDDSDAASATPSIEPRTESSSTVPLLIRYQAMRVGPHVSLLSKHPAAA